METRILRRAWWVPFLGTLVAEAYAFIYLVDCATDPQQSIARLFLLTVAASGLTLLAAHFFGRLWSPPTPIHFVARCVISFFVGLILGALIWTYWLATQL